MKKVYERDYNKKHTKGDMMFIKLNDRVYLNKDHITRIKVDEVKDGIRVRFYGGNVQVAKSKIFPSTEAANLWIAKIVPLKED